MSIGLVAMRASTSILTEGAFDEYVEELWANMPLELRRAWTAAANAVVRAAIHELTESGDVSWGLRAANLVAHNLIEELPTDVVLPSERKASP